MLSVGVSGSPRLGASDLHDPRRPPAPSLGSVLPQHGAAQLRVPRQADAEPESRSSGVCTLRRDV